MIEKRKSCNRPMKPDPMAEDSLEDLRRKVGRAMADAHQSKHWTCDEEECHKDGSPINQIMQLLNAYTTNKINEGRLNEIKILEAKWIKDKPVMLDRYFEDRIAELEALNHRKEQ